MSSLASTPSLPAESLSTPQPGVTLSASRNTTIVSVVTATVTPTFIFTSPIISTETTVQYTTIPGPDPAATAAIASASAILATGATRYDTKFIIIVAISGSTFLLILILALIFLIYFRHKRRKQKAHPTDTPPFTSLNAPRTPSYSSPIPGTAPQIPPQTYPTSLSLGPTRNVSTQALAINYPPPVPIPNRPPTRPRRSISEPMLIPDHLRRDFPVTKSQTQRIPKSPTAGLPQALSTSPSRVPKRPSPPLREPTVPEIAMITTTPLAQSTSAVRRDGGYSPPRSFPLIGTSRGNVPAPEPVPPRTPRYREGFPAHLMGERARIEAEKRRRAREENAAAGVSSGGVGGVSSSLVSFYSSHVNAGQEKGGGGTRLAVSGNEAIDTQTAYGNVHSRDESGGLTSTRASSGIFPE